MNSDFYITLKKVIITNDDYYNHIEYDNAVFHLESDLNKLQRYLKEVTPKTANVGKNYAEYAFNQISKEKIRIKKYFTDLPKPDIKKLSKYDIENYDAEIDYFSEILNLIDDARGDLLEYLIAIYPDEYSNEKSITLVKDLLPDTSEIKLQFLGRLDNKPIKENNDKVKFNEKEVDDIFDILKAYFPGQEDQFKKILKSRGSGGVPLIFSGDGIKLAHTFKFLFASQAIILENGIKEHLINWIAKNFEYKKGSGKIYKFSSVNGGHLQRCISGIYIKGESRTLIERTPVGKFCASFIEQKKYKKKK